MTRNCYANEIPTLYKRLRNYYAKKKHKTLNNYNQKA